LVKISQRLVVMDGKKQVDRFHPGALVRFIIPARGYFQNLDPGGPWRNTHSTGNAPLLNSLSQLAKKKSTLSRAWN
jgi:hypothetical protein